MTFLLVGRERLRLNPSIGTPLSENGGAQVMFRQQSCVIVPVKFCTTSSRPKRCWGDVNTLPFFEEHTSTTIAFYLYRWVKMACYCNAYLPWILTIALKLVEYKFPLNRPLAMQVTNVLLLALIPFRANVEFGVPAPLKYAILSATSVLVRILPLIVQEIPILLDSTEQWKTTFWPRAIFPEGTNFTGGPRFNEVVAH